MLVYEKNTAIANERETMLSKFASHHEKSSTEKLSLPPRSKSTGNLYPSCNGVKAVRGGRRTAHLSEADAKARQSALVAFQLRRNRSTQHYGSDDIYYSCSFRDGSQHMKPSRKPTCTSTIVVRLYDEASGQKSNRESRRRSQRRPYNLPAPASLLRPHNDDDEIVETSIGWEENIDQTERTGSSYSMDDTGFYSPVRSSPSRTRSEEPLIVLRGAMTQSPIALASPSRRKNRYQSTKSPSPATQPERGRRGPSLDDFFAKIKC